MPDDPALHIFPDDFVPHVQASSLYKTWAKQNPGEAKKWATFRDAVIAGQQLAPPQLSTLFGKSLIDSAREHMSISRVVGQVVPPYPPPVTPPPSGGGLTPQGPQTISAGGSYTGWWQTSGAGQSGAALTIATSAPVLIQDSIIEALSPTAYCAYSGANGNNVTFRRCTFITPVGGEGRALATQFSSQVTVENCTITRTCGIYIQGPLTGADIHVAKNTAMNQQPCSYNNTVFFQINNGLNVASCLIEWNQVVNNFQESLIEDGISIYQSNGAMVRNNFLYGGYPATATSPSSGDGINLGDGGGSNNTAHDNQVVAFSNAGIGLVAGANNHAYNNRVVADGRTDTGIEVTNSNVGLVCYTTVPGDNNTLYGNYVGWMQGSAYGHPISRADLYCPTADNNVDADNTWAYGNHSTPMTHADELAEWPIWQAKLTANGITLGA